MLVKGSVPGHKGSVVIIKPTQKKYTPKEIFTEDTIEALPTTDEEKIVDEVEKKESIEASPTTDEEKIVDEVEKKESNEQDDK
jgi:hypothetical protein